MLLSIILPVYNAEKFLVNCINSLVSQDISSSDYEIIIINDGSTDTSSEIINQFASDYKNITVRHQANHGLGATRNTSVSLAKGDYIYFIDSDDYIAHNSLGTLVSYLKKERCDILTFNTQITKSLNLHSSSTTLNTNLNISPIDGVSYIAKTGYRNEVWWYIINREFLLQTNIIFTERRWLEDGIYTASLFLKAKKIISLPFDIHRYVKSPESIMASREENHYNKMIYDMADSTSFFNDLIQESSSKINNPDCITRLKSRQESYSFFLIIRFLRSNLSYKVLKELLVKLKNANAYPLHYFTKRDHNKPHFQLISIVFNNKTLLFICFQVFRLLRKMKFIGN